MIIIISLSLSLSLSIYLTAYSLSSLLSFKKPKLEDNALQLQFITAVILSGIIHTRITWAAHYQGSSVGPITIGQDGETLIIFCLLELVMVRCYLGACLRG